MYRVFQFNLHVTAAYCATALAVGAIEATLGLYAGLGVFLTIPLLFAAMLEGQYAVRTLGSAPPPRHCWYAAFCMGCLTGALAAIGWVVWMLFLDPLLAAAGRAEWPISWAKIAVCVGLTVPLLRIGYAIGVASEMRSARLGQM